MDWWNWNIYGKWISNYLTAQGISTPRMSEKQWKDEAVEENRIKAKPEWSIVSVQGIIDNDFYIGTFCQRKYTQKGQRGGHEAGRGRAIVIENHHQHIIDYRTFAITRSLREKRTTSHYQGVKKNDNVYSGFTECGDCGSPMFATSHSDMKPATISGWTVWTIC